MERIKTDILVIGAGSGGLSVAAGAVQMGASVVLLEDNEMGGDCLNYGCVPSKSLIASARVAHGMTRASVYGIADETPRIDYGAAMEQVQGVIATIAPVDSQERFEKLGVRVIRARGRFISPTEVQAGEHVIAARRVVLATGSSPLVPPIPGLDTVPYLTNETLWTLRERPEHLIIIGGGPIGMEMAQAHRRLGSKVTVIESQRALGKDDPEMTAIVLDRLRDEGIEIAEYAKAAEVRGSAGALEVTVEGGTVFRGSHLLVAVGRRANVDALDLDKAGIRTTQKGIEVDAQLRTSNKAVYAIGDVAGGLQFTHVANYHAGIVVRSALFGLPAKASTAHLPWVSYTDPELAQVGLTEEHAKKKHGMNVEVVRFHYAEIDRAVAERRSEGMIKVMVVRGRPVGASIVGHQAGEHIGLWALVLANRLKMRHVANMVAPYPTFGEINKRAAGTYFSPRLFDNAMVRRVVGLVQRWLP